MYRFAANLAYKARVAKSTTQQGLNVAVEQSYGVPKVKSFGATNGASGDGCRSVAAGMNVMDQSYGTSMVSKVGEIAQVGDARKAEDREKKDRFTYALNPTKAAGLLGIVPGGGLGLLYAPKNLATANVYQNIGMHTFSSSAGAQGEANLTSTLRPLSPHLPIYKPQPSSTSSIFHRITGLFLTTMVLSFYLITMKMGSVCLTFENFYQFLFYSSKLTILSAEVSALALSYHFYNGLRHLWTDYAGFPFLGRKSSGALKAIAKKGH